MRFYRETSLQDICLSIIVSNFRLLFFQYEKLEFFKRFLCKKYSQEIYERLKTNDLLEEKYTNWLITPEWKLVVLEESYNLNYFIPKFQICGQLLNSVNFKNSSATVEILSAVVCLLPNITELNLVRTNCTDDLLLLIRKVCPHLNSLRIAKCKVSDNGVKNLCYVNQEEVGFPSLRFLDVEGTRVGINGLKYILSNLNLHVLSHIDLELAVSLLYKENKCKAKETFKPFDLKNFFLLLNSIPTLTLDALLTMCPNLEKIKLLKVFYDEDYDVLKKFQRLYSVAIMNLPNEEVSPNGLSDFLQVKGYFLTELLLANSTISIGSIVKNCCNLKKLLLVCVQYQEFDETKIEGKYYLNKLLELTIKSVNLHQSTNYKSINILLKSCKYVECLTIYNVSSLLEVFIDHIGTNMPNLIKAKFFYTGINLISAKKLFACESLKYLYLDGCPYIKNDELLELSQCNSHGHGNTLAWQIKYNGVSDRWMD